MSSAASLQTGGPGIFTISGPLTVATVTALRQQGLQQFRRDDAQTLQVNLVSVSTVDSAGLALLIDWLAWAEANGRRLRFDSLPPALQALASLSEVDALLQPAAV